VTPDRFARVAPTPTAAGQAALAAAQALARKSAATRCNQTVPRFLGTAWAIRTEKLTNYSPPHSRSAALDRVMP
jgi:hypothetical protein